MVSTRWHRRRLARGAPNGYRVGDPNGKRRCNEAMDLNEQYQRFLSWQCRLRKLSMRELGGRPTDGMTAGVYSVNGGDEQSRMNFLIMRRDPETRTQELRHIVRKTPDSSQWLENGLRLLAERSATTTRKTSSSTT